MRRRRRAAALPVEVPQEEGQEVGVAGQAVEAGRLLHLPPQVQEALQPPLVLRHPPPLLLPQAPPPRTRQTQGYGAQPQPLVVVVVVVVGVVAGGIWK